MIAKYLRQVALDNLRSSINENLSLYRSGDFAYLRDDPGFYFEHPVEIDLDGLAALKKPVIGEYFEAENCATIYSALSALSPYEARDERF